MKAISSPFLVSFCLTWVKYSVNSKLEIWSKADYFFLGYLSLFFLKMVSVKEKLHGYVENWKEGLQGLKWSGSSWDWRYSWPLMVLET